MQRSTRVNYDAIAERYDSTPHREKSADPELIAFLAGRGRTATLTLLDIACGTGNQQIANWGLTPNAKRQIRRSRRLARDVATGATQNAGHRLGARRQRGVAVCLGQL
jgi:hypothetical protein